MRRNLHLILTLGLVLGLLGLVPRAAASTPAACDLVVATSGSDTDTGDGSTLQPFATVGRLVESLRPGQTGCVRQGFYQFGEVIIDTPNVTLMSYPGETATLQGRVWATRNAAGSAVENLDLDGRNPSAESASPTINADHFTLAGNDITNHHTSICVAVGSMDSAYGRATGVVIEGNHIHDCGALPARNHDHGIYLEAATDTVIRGNWVYDNSDRGIQLYPDADGTTITENVIDGNGEGIIFSGDDGVASNDNVVERNVITNSRIRHNVESSFPEGNPIGKGNIVRHNCIYGAAGWYGEGDGSAIESPQVGFTATENVIAAPDFVDRVAHDYELAPGSPCLNLGESVRLSPGPPTNGGTIQVDGELPQSVGVTSSVITVLGQHHRRWVRVGRRRVAHVRFHLRLRLPRSMRHAVAVRIKAKAPGMVSSRPVRIKKRRGGRAQESRLWPKHRAAKAPGKGG
jgi:parallel beta-helix repeat protein